VIGSVGANVRTYVDATVVVSTTYCYRAQAFNSAGASPYSNESCATASASIGSNATSSSPPGERPSLEQLSPDQRGGDQLPADRHDSWRGKRHRDRERTQLQHELLDFGRE